MKLRSTLNLISLFCTRKICIAVIVLLVVLGMFVLRTQDNLSSRKISSQIHKIQGRIFKLSNGVEVPAIGFGTAGLGSDAKNAITTAIQEGYILFDTASDTGPWYKSEKVIGDVIRELHLDRKSLFLTSKLHPQDFGNVRASFESTLRNLNTNYLDMYIMHYPRCYPNLCKQVHDIHFLQAWEEMEMLYEEGKIRAIGVSNFHLADIKQLYKESKIRPHIIQSHSDPFKQNRPIIELAQIYGITFQSYSPLGSQWVIKQFKNPVLSDPVLFEIAYRHNKSVPQVVLRWLLQENILVIPKSRNPNHIKENIDIFNFKLRDEDIAMIRNLDGKIKLP